MKPVSDQTLCLIQISRMGDLLQTYQAALGAKSGNPNLRLILIAREKFARPLEFLLKQVFDKIYFLDLKQMIKTRTQSLSATLTEINLFLNQINTENPKVIINLSFSKSSSYLLGLLKTNFRLGPYKNNYSQLVIEDQWGQFIYSNVMGGANNPFHLVDLFRMMIGGPRVLHSHLATPSQTEKKQIIFHPFASQKKKVWPLEKWIPVLMNVLTHFPELEILVMGSSGDRSRVEFLLNHQHLEQVRSRIINLAGQVELPELLQQMEQSRLFIGHDSMGGHLASLSGIPSLTLSLGTVRPQETTPYGENQFNIAPRISCFPCFPTDPCQDLPCHQQIPPEVVTAAIIQLIEDQRLNLTKLEGRFPSSALANLTFYQSTINSFGDQKLMRLSQDEFNLQEVFLNYYQILWNFFLRDLEETLPFPKINSQTAYHLKYYSEGLEKYYELQGFGKKYTQYLIEELNKEKIDQLQIQSISAKLGEIDRLANLLKNSFPLLAPLIDYFHVVRSNLSGKYALALAAQSLNSYQESVHCSSILYELIGQSLKSFTTSSSGPKTRPSRGGSIAKNFD